MAFLILNGTTIRVQSNTATEDWQPHGQDRERMFDGAMRMTRRGIYRSWKLTSKLLTSAEAQTLIALINSTTLPLAMSGDLCIDDCAVMPLQLSNNPVQTADGFKRRVVFQLDETPQALPPDTSANVFLFLREGVRQFTDRAGTVAAGGTDLVRYWGDANGSGRAAIGEADIFSFQPRGTLDGAGAVNMGVSSTGSGASFILPDMHTFTGGAILTKLKVAATPSDTHLWLLNRDGHEAENTRYPDADDGHIWDSFGTQNATDFGLPPDDDDLTGYRVYEVVQTSAERTARFNGAQLYTSAGPFTGGNAIYFPTAGRLSGSINTEFFDGTVQRLVILQGDPTAAQLRSWRDYMLGLVEDPPLP